MKRPDVYDYLEHHGFLKDWIQFLKESKKMTLRSLSSMSGVSVAIISLCLSGDRRWTLKILGKLIPHLDLKKPEQEALRLLFSIGSTDDPIERLAAFDELRRIPAYTEKQRDSSTVYLYLRHWLNVAIRELAQMSDFVADAKWIRERLRFMPTEIEIQRSLKFLIKEGYLKKDEAGKWTTPKSHLDCQDGIYRLSLGEYHRQILQLAQRSIEEIPSDKRLINGHTAALNHENKKKAEDIIKKALAEIQLLSGDQQNPDQLYHFEFVMMPLSQEGQAA